MGVQTDYPLNSAYASSVHHAQRPDPAGHDLQPSSSNDHVYEELWSARDVITDLDAPLFHQHAACGNVEVLEALLRNKADVNQLDHYGRTALHFAALNGDLPAAEFLIEKRGDILCRASDGKIPMHYAAENNQAEMVMFLENMNRHTKKEIFHSRNYLMCDIFSIDTNSRNRDDALRNFDDLRGALQAVTQDAVASDGSSGGKNVSVKMEELKQRRQAALHKHDQIFGDNLTLPTPP
ncbi:hypothetical protein GUITHDRAFT_111860 [Guillardia theta CCMP2712]|uniref:Uncharacterized protein n=1 Tax=Guillardia theta (strain CCMP2712) TaxID=905079 RepID=L1J0H1_GUITC|nr:hypothetical protein GUITHDRAFT_111860 [Guillardia theta CCMP2712]EKX42006.1 hypothetical protein GUITHDRAFT_111860 [Guillardia theta CCMP2712]|eukprot:XP_005828986.1 hypothetical protein GUITHDRAFT_111860 [Guillardia theta CCMP2712]